ncbi:hypothetical protein Q1695_006243 [Nippostrongylus brasiliensis]|nr:hypothetical protein Q1695_006243 [Nippostrongylus brasiliensis]
MSCVWWDWQGVIYYELLKKNHSVNSDIYVQQMEHLHSAIQQKRRNRNHGVLLHDNARPHTARRTKNVIQAYGWEILPHPPYSPDLAPSDFHLLRSLSNAISGTSFDSEAQLGTWLDEFFESKSPDFYKRGIDNLVNCWERVVQNNGEYITD